MTIMTTIRRLKDWRKVSDNRYGPGFVYLLMRDDGWFRIGRTASPIERFRQWRWMASVGHYTLTPILMIEVPNQHLAEKMLHEIFDRKRTDERHRGLGPRHEWFKLDKTDLLDFAEWAEIIGEKFHFFYGEWPDAVPSND